MKILKKYIPSTLLLLLLNCGLSSSAQNIIGLKILIGEDAPAFLAFPSEVDNARWDNSEMNEYFKFSTRNENTMQISYNGKKDPPTGGTGFSVIQGKNTHIFTLVFKKNYDINKDPVLYYDFSDKSKLKTAAERAKSQEPIQQNTQPQEDRPITVAAIDTKKQEQEDKEQKELQRKEDDKRKKEMALAQEQKKREVEAQQKAEVEKAKQEEKLRESEIAKAKADADHIAAEQKKAKEAAEAITKANAEADRKKAAEATRLKKEREAEAQQLALQAAQQKEKDKQEADKAKVERDRMAREEAEHKRLAVQEEKERIAKAAQEKADAERERKMELARQQAEAKQKAKEEADAKLLALQLQKEEAQKNAQYTLVGLWNRYGKKGINLYDIPPEQYNNNNVDFYVAKDTIQNYENSSAFLNEAPRLDIATEAQQGIDVTLESISFKGPFAYYRVRVNNNSKDDYLLGANVLAWYNADGSPKAYLKCSYLTNIGSFPLVKPGANKSYIYVTRAANIKEDDDLVLMINERRSEYPKFNLVFNGAVYHKELARVEKPINNQGQHNISAPEQKESKKERKERELREKKAGKNKVKDTEE